MIIIQGKYRGITYIYNRQKNSEKKSTLLTCRQYMYICTYSRTAGKMTVIVCYFSQLVGFEMKFKFS